MIWKQIHGNWCRWTFYPVKKSVSGSFHPETTILRDTSMEKDVLSTIIEIEKEIEERLESERRKAVQWLDSAKKEIEVELAANVRELKDSLMESVDIARENAEKQASAILSEAAKQSRLLSEIGDETLKRIITEHLRRILPGSDYDCQDVQS